MKSSILLSALLSSALLLNGCVSARSATKEISASTPLPAPTEQTELIRIEEPDRREAAFAPVIAFLGTSLGQAAGKALLRLSSSALNRYAQNFEAAYSATLVADDFNRMLDAKSISDRRDYTYTYQFRRYLVFKSTDGATFTKAQIAAALKLDPATLPDTAVFAVPNDSVTKFVTFEYKFDLKHGGANSEAVRVVPVAVRYHAPAARKLQVPLTKSDDLHATITVALREGHQPDAKNFNRTFHFTAPVADLATSAGDLKMHSSDWMPAFAGRNYSIEVKVLESSDAKKWIEQAAKKLGEWGDAKLDDLKS